MPAHRVVRRGHARTVASNCVVQRGHARVVTAHGVVQRGYAQVVTANCVVQRGYAQVVTAYCVVQRGYAHIVTAYRVVQNGFMTSRHTRQWLEPCRWRSRLPELISKRRRNALDVTRRQHRMGLGDLRVGTDRERIADGRWRFSA